MSGLAPSPRRAARGYAPLIVLLAALAAFTSMVPTTGLEAIRSEQVAGGGVVTVPGAPGQAGTATGAPGSATTGGSSTGGGGRGRRRAGLHERVRRPARCRCLATRTPRRA